MTRNVEHFLRDRLSERNIDSDIRVSCLGTQLLVTFIPASHLDSPRIRLLMQMAEEAAKAYGKELVKSAVEY